MVAYLQSLLGEAERKNGWTLAEAAGDTTAGATPACLPKTTISMVVVLAIAAATKVAPTSIPRLYSPMLCLETKMTYGRRPRRINSGEH
jgi:hypothetical protein